MSNYQFQNNTSAANLLDYNGNHKGNVAMQLPVDDDTLLLAKGIVLTLNNTGTVQPAINTDFPIGFVYVPNNPDYPAGNELKDEVTVRTLFTDVGYGFSDSAVAIGDLVSANDISALPAAAGKKMKYSVATTGNYAIGVALTAAGATDVEIKVGLLASPVLVP